MEYIYYIFLFFSLFPKFGRKGLFFGRNAGFLGRNSDNFGMNGHKWARKCRFFSTKKAMPEIIGTAVGHGTQMKKKPV